MQGNRGTAAVQHANLRGIRYLLPACCLNSCRNASFSLHVLSRILLQIGLSCLLLSRSRSVTVWTGPITTPCPFSLSRLVSSLRYSFAMQANE